MKRSFIAAILLLSSALGLKAQNEVDALRYSQLDVVGSARYAGMGGAFGALGDDMGTLSLNPAGIGVFNNTTASVTMSVFGANTDATFLGSNTSDSKLNFNFPSVGFVARFKRRKGEEKQWAWKAFHLGVAYNRTNNFNRLTSISGINTQSSLVDQWVGQLNNAGVQYTDIPYDVIPGADFSDAYMGWGTFLVDTVPGSSDQYLRHVLPNYGQLQQVTEVTKGSMNEVALSFGGNFGNALYIGATIGIPMLNYQTERRYTETDVQDTIADFTSFTKTDYLSAKGNGFNFKFGLIYRPVKWLRVGAAIHTPTFYDIDELYKSVLVSNLDGTQYSQSTLQGTYGYNLQTPFRAIGSLGFVIGKVGLISADYEYVNYSLAKFRSNDYSFNTENGNVKSRLHWAGNIRVGTEWRLDIVSLRAGFAMNGDPYTGAYNFNDTRYSLGAGLRWKRFFTDLTYQLRRNVQNYEMYDVALVPLANITTWEHNVLMSFGFRF